jgi:NodT family efflux transporter outer membrane factor (OMF) lipoprotein
MTRSFSALRLLAPLAAIALTAGCCAVGPDYQRPDLKLTAAYMGAPVASPTAPAPIESWWTGFGDPELVRVVERAGAQNLDVQQAAARILQARAVARGAGAALLPHVDANGQAASVRQSLLSPIGQIGSHLPGFPRDLDDYQVGAAASWEIDLFGGLRRERDAALADAGAAQADGAAVRVSVAADAADAYLQVRAYQARIAVARGQETTEQDLVALLNRRIGEGVSPERELHEAQAELDGVRAAIPPLTAGLERQLNRLDVLMGAQPGTFRAELETPAPIPQAPGLSIAEGPADLLRRRPDVVAAEKRLVAANAGIGAVIADYYPKISVSGLLGVDSVDAARLFTPLAGASQIGAGLRWRLFDFGRVDAEVAQARGRKAQALAAWRASVLKASEDVEDALSDLGQQQARANALARQIAELTTARNQSQQAFDGGVISLVEVRDADRDLLTASDQLVQARAGAARAAVAAYRALGGGWSAAGTETVAAR